MTPVAPRAQWKGSTGCALMTIAWPGLRVSRRKKCLLRAPVQGHPQQHLVPARLAWHQRPQLHRPLLYKTRARTSELPTLGCVPTAARALPQRPTLRATARNCLPPPPPTTQFQGGAQPRLHVGGLEFVCRAPPEHHLRPALLKPELVMAASVVVTNQAGTECGYQEGGEAWRWQETLPSRAPLRWTCLASWCREVLWASRGR